MKVKVTIITLLCAILTVVSFILWLEVELLEPKIIHMHNHTVAFPASYWKETYPDPVTTKQGLEYISEARFTHQLLIDKGNPPSETGNVTHHEKWVRRYDQLKDLIIRLDSND